MELYDVVASEYGYTINEFMDLDFRRLWGMLERIRIRTNNELNYQIAIHGGKPTFMKLQKQIEEMSVEQKEIIAKATRDAVKRKVNKKIHGIKEK